MPCEAPRDALFRVGERCLGVLAAENGVLEFRPERVLDLAVVRQRPVAGQLVGVLELRLQHGVGQRIFRLHRGQHCLVGLDIGGEHPADLVNSVAHLLLVKCLTMAKASSGFFDLFDTPKP